MGQEKKGAVSSHVLLRMLHTQLLVRKLLTWLFCPWSMPGLMQGSAAGKARSAAQHAAQTDSADSLHESAQFSPAAQSVPGPGASPLVPGAALQYNRLAVLPSQLHLLHAGWWSPARQQLLT